MFHRSEDERRLMAKVHQLGFEQWRWAWRELQAYRTLPWWRRLAYRLREGGIWKLAD